jgi:hypothetical protein
MPRANKETSLKRLLRVACCVLTWMLCAPAASAATIFVEDFNDGNAGDGIPETWVPGSGTWNATSGDYVATGSLPRVSRVPEHFLGDTSARTQARVVGNVEAGLAVRRPMVNRGYAGVIRPDGSMSIARVDGTPVILSSAVVPFNPVQQDVMLQFDAFGDKLSLWAWPVSEPMPNEPQIVVFDNKYAEGPVGLISAGFAGLPSDSTTFRFVHVADTHIVPEPSTLVLMSLGGFVLLCARRRKRAACTLLGHDQQHRGNRTRLFARFARFEHGQSQLAVRRPLAGVRPPSC